jgi:hypothetical protein
MPAAIPKRPAGLIRGVGNVEMPGELESLYQHRVQRGKIRQLDNYDATLLHIFSRDVLRRIKERGASREAMVPPEVARMIQKRWFCGYSGDQPV